MSQTALFSLNDTSQAVRFAGALVRSGWKIVASEETSRLLEERNLPSIKLADFTGYVGEHAFPATMHPNMEAALTTDCVDRIDLVFCINYPFEKGQDIGGRTLLALAIKGERIAVHSNADMELVCQSILTHTVVPNDLKLAVNQRSLASIAFFYLTLAENQDALNGMTGTKYQRLRNGENPYQAPAYQLADPSSTDALALHKFEQVSGETPCYTNLADADSILRPLALAAQAFKLNLRAVPNICIAAKHGNPCGMGVSWNDAGRSILNALWGNPRAIWGGEVITNFKLTAPLAKLLLKSEQRQTEYNNGYWMLDIVLAPEYELSAINILGHRKGRKLLRNTALHSPDIDSQTLYRQVRGGFLMQPKADYILNLKACHGSDRNNITKQIDDMIIAWSTAYSSFHGGNEVALANQGALIGAGGGPSTIEAAELAVLRAESNGHTLENSSFAADAFFPFTDAPETLCKAGVASGCVPWGGKHAEQVQQYFEAQGVSIAYIPEIYRGFCRH